MRLSKLPDFLGRPEYWEESWRLAETCCHSDSSERPSADSGVKNSLEIIIIIVIIIIIIIIIIKWNKHKSESNLENETQNSETNGSPIPGQTKY